LEDRVDDGRKIWKLSPMDLKSYHRWDDYTRAREAMFRGSDTPWAPWFVASSEDKRRVRLNVISHLLNHIPYKALPERRVKLGKRRVGTLKEARYEVNTVPEKY
jgi:polyphosphate kinase 2 (PPK2 family)